MYRVYLCTCGTDRAATAMGRSSFQWSVGLARGHRYTGHRCCRLLVCSREAASLGARGFHLTTSPAPIGYEQRAYTYLLILCCLISSTDERSLCMDRQPSDTHTSDYLQLILHCYSHLVILEIAYTAAPVTSELFSSLFELLTPLGAGDNPFSSWL